MISHQSKYKFYCDKVGIGKKSRTCRVAPVTSSTVEKKKTEIQNKTKTNYKTETKTHTHTQIKKKCFS